MASRLVSRAGWMLSAALFATLLSSIRHVDYVGAVPIAVLALIAVVAAVRPEVGVRLVVLITPVAWWVAVRYWNAVVSWPEAVVCAALTGLSIDAARRFRPLPFSLSAPIGVLVVLIVASMTAGLGVSAMRLGPSFTDAVMTHLTREHFIDIRGFPALHAGLRLLEGILLFALAARLSFTRDALRRIGAAMVLGATIASLLNLLRLIESASRSELFWTALIDLSQRLRWNVHYADHNAAGSYFVLALFVALALLVRAGRIERVAWSGGAILIAAALWLTSSRVAILAGILAGVAVIMLRYLSRGRAQALRAAAIGAAALVLLVVLAVALPQRGQQQSPLLSADVRVGLMHTAVRMIASRPVFGIGLGEFYRRTGEFSSDDLKAKFPVTALGENAHNNFLQVAAELGLAGGLFFTWLVSAGLLAAGRKTFASDDRFLMLALTGIGAFTLTLIGGHPLLVAEPGFLFWTMFGALAGCCTTVPASAATAAPRWRWSIAAVAIAILVTLPWRMSALLQDAELEHVGIGVSSAWQTAPDGVRYREATGHATLFAPTGAVKFRVNPQTNSALKLEVKLDGRVADVIALQPGTWTQVMLPARTQHTNYRYVRVDLRLVDVDETRMWITKVEPLR